VRSALVRLVRFLVGLFYRRIEVVGLEYVPREGPLLLLANHNNGLVDPMVVLYALSRPVVFVAKSTLWKIPLLRSLLGLLGCVPVVRKGEGEPGISLKGEERNSFTRKDEFRSDVLLRAGPPVPPPPDPTVEGWTVAMGAALEAVTLNADDWKDHEVVVVVETLYGERIRRDFLEGEEGEGEPLGRALRVRQLLLAARGALEKSHPGEVASLARLRVTRDALVAECDRLADSFRVLSDNPRA
jgi:hypothetical protein